MKKHKKTTYGILLLVIMMLIPVVLFSEETSGDPKSTNPVKDPKDIQEKVTIENNFIISGDEPEEIYMNLTYEKLFSKTIPAYLFNNNLYIPINDLLNELRINYSLKNSGRIIEGSFITNDLKYIINFETMTANIGEKFINFSKNDFLKMNDSYYIIPSIFENLFNSRIDVNFSNLFLTVRSKDKLPVMIFRERELGRTDLKKNETEEEKFHLYKKERKYLNAGFLDYSFSAGISKNSLPNYNYELSLGTEFLGGDLKTSLKGDLKKESYDNFDPHFLWKYAFNTNPFLNQIYIGELNYNGLFSGSINGIEVTNTPIEPRTSFDKFTIRERTIPNSDVELYINNQLYDFKKADALGNVFFEIPLTFGSNLVYMKIYSPTGEIIDSEKKIQVPSGFLPAGSIDYNVSFGELKESKDKLLSANVAVGITNWLTSKVGVEKINNDLFSTPVFYNSLNARIFSEYIMNVTYAPQLYKKASINASYASDLYFEISHANYNENKVYNKTNIKNESSLIGLIPFEIGSSMFVSQILLKNSEYFNQSNTISAVIDQSFNIQNLRASINFNHVRSNNFKHSEIQNKISFGTNYMMPSIGVFKSNALNMKIDYNVTNKSFENLQASILTNLSKTMRLQLGYQTNFQPGNNSVSAQFIFELPFSRNYVTVNNNSFTSVMQGSIGMDANYDKILFYNKHQVGSSAVSFRMFFDENNNGKYDKGEEIIEDAIIDLKQAGTFDKTENGVLRLTELIPNQEYTVEVNESSIKNPMLIPKYKKFSFIPSANTYKKIDIPLLMSQEVFGSVTIVSGERELKLGGIEVVVKNLETNEITTLSTFFDGGIYSLGFLPGKYVAYVQPSHLKNLNPIIKPEEIFFTIYNDNDSHENDELNFIIEISEED